MSYVTKLGAYGLAVVAAFAVALAVLVSVSSTPQAEAATVRLGATDTTADAQPGDKVVIPGAATATIVEFSITGGTASGSFASGGGQSIACSDSTTTPARGCDVMDGTGIQVELNIDADSPDGFIIVKRDVILPTTGVADDSVVITVTTQPKPASLTVKAVSTTIDANGAIDSVGDAGRTQIVATVKNDQSPAAGMNGQRLTFITTLGVMDCPSSSDADGANTIAAATNVQWCQVWTTGQDNPTTTATETAGAAFDGHAVVSLKASGREGAATVTVTHGTLDPATETVTLFGSAKNLVAEAEQSSVEVGGSVFVVLTVTDSVGNPVKGAQPQPASKDPIVAPAKDDNKVTTSQAADDGDAATSPYNVNKDVDGDGTIDRGDLPACGPVTAVTADPDADPPVQGVFASTGTNDAGKCVVQVMATKDDATTTTNEASARGVHTLNFEIGTEIKASVEITVAGAPHAISSDAPPEVAALTDTKITVTVRDDEGVLVGETAINVIKVAGDGLAEGDATKDDAKTKNGSATFSYAAGLGGRVVFRVIAGSGASEIRDVITLTVRSDVDPEEDPDAMALPDPPDFVRIALAADGTLRVVTTPSAPGAGVTVEAEVSRNDGGWMAVPSGAAAIGDYTGRARFVEAGRASRWRYSVNSVTVAPEAPDTPDEPDTPVGPTAPTLTVQGNLGSFSGGSLAELAAAANAACPGGSVIWAQDGNGDWQVWSSSAPSIANIGFTTAFSGGFSGPRLLWVATCDGGGMDNEN